jgi:predicted dehydrogenase
VRRLVESGELGTMTRFESRFDRFRPRVGAERWRESGDPGDGGGLLLDLGAHLVDQALVLFGFPRRVYAAGVRPGDPDWGAGEPARFADAEGERTVEVERGAYERFYEGVRDALRGDAAMPVDPRDSVAALHVIDAARRSARSAAVIDTTEEMGT